MAFERLPGRQLHFPSEGSVAVKPIPAVFPTAAIVQQAIAGILKTIDPVERAKNKALIAYYNQLAENGGTKPMTPQQQATLYNTMLRSEETQLDIAEKRRKRKQYDLSPFFQAGQADVGDSGIPAPTQTTPQVPYRPLTGPQSSNDTLSGVPSDSNLYSMGSGVNDPSAIEERLRLDPRERGLLEQGLV